MQTAFDSSEHEPYAEPGANAVSGRAFLAQEGSAPATCAGTRVLLIPATPYFREMFWHLVVRGSEPLPPEKPNPNLKNMIRRTMCDAKGNFSFSHIAAGNWFVLTEINAKRGGVLITEFAVQNGETTEVLLTDKHLVNR